MTMTTMTNVQRAASQLLDTLMKGKDISLDLSFQDDNAGAAEQLMMAINEEARRRDVGVIIELIGEKSLCLSLRRS